MTPPAPVRIRWRAEPIDVAAITPPLTSAIAGLYGEVSVAPKPVPVTFSFPLLVTPEWRSRC